ncbi:MAG: alpha/beta hydrolase [Oscillospiraceae bacterium]|jgi:pimeloyl-ACP methyl ester carboxylesterase|nr:alpha/beta hydrolase [uncultured Oscillibacter sp.]MCI9288577.1 alpha/beta hydrolase [Oscillospiraceae bacterium]
MEKTKKTAQIILCISLALMLLCGIVVNAVQTSGGKVAMRELTIETDSGYTMSAYLLVPKTATAENPAPAIVTSHGYLNNKEMTDANYVELARRGFVVLAIDQPDHGDSDVTPDFFILAPDGVYQGVLALSRMPFVDTSRIGVTGHSMGSWSVNAAIQADNLNETPLIAAALIHCNDPLYQDADGNFANPYGSRDVAVISAIYDEFFGTSVSADGQPLSSPYFMETATAQTFLNFGRNPAESEVREAYTEYREDVDGKETLRIVYRPPIIHPWSHFSARSESYICDFFSKTLSAPNPIDPNNQVWQWKEAFNFVGVIGFVLFLCSFTTLLVFTPTFACLRADETVKPMPVKDKTGKLWFWLSLAAGSVFGSLVYLTLVNMGNSMAVAQGEAMGLGLWSTACGLFTILSMAVYYFVYGKKNGLDLAERGVKMPLKKLGLSVLLALIVVTVGYGLVFVEDYFFLADFRLWTLAIKAFELPILRYLPYVLLFFTYYIAISVATNCFNYNDIGGKANGVICALFAALPAVVLPAIQYGTYYSTNHMMWFQRTMADPNYPMYVLWLFPIILILFGSTLVTRVIYKHTKNPYIAGIINALIVGLLTITNTCSVFVG